MPHAVRCPRCLNLSRIESDEAGTAVACPHCRATFTAEPAAPPPRDKPIPVVYPATQADIDADADDDPGEPPHATPVTVGLALLPLGIPLIWLLLPVLTGRAAIFSFAAPVALGLGLVGLCLGVVYAAHWTVATRVRAIVMLVLIGYGTAGFLYFMKKEWAQAITRRLLVPPAATWPSSTTPDGLVTVKAPTELRPGDAAPLPDWPLAAIEGRFEGAVRVHYAAATGPPAAAVEDRLTGDDAWFDDAKRRLVKACGGELKSEEKLVVAKKYPARDYEITVPDAATDQVVRVVRLVRVKGARRLNKAVYLAAEGAFLGRDVPHVRQFLDSLELRIP